LTKNLLAINQFIRQSLGEWKSIRSTHSLAFQEVEVSTSKILIENIDLKNKKVIDLLEKYNNTSTTNLIGISVSWEVISDWEQDQKFEHDQTIMLFLPKSKNSGIVLRNKGYTESVISSSEYLIDENESLHIKTTYNTTLSEERICFLSTHVRSRYSVTRNKDNNVVMQTSHTSEIRNLSTLKD